MKTDGEQAVRRGVRELDRMVERVDRDDRRDRAERLLRRDERVGRDAVEDRRLPVEIGGEAVRRAEPPATSVAPRSSASPTCSSIFAAPLSLLSGPIVVASANGSPSTIRSVTRRASRSTNGPTTSRCTSSRSPAVQLWPAQRKQAVTVASAAASRSASSSTTTGPLPPISSSSDLPAAGRGDLAAGLGRADEARRACVPGFPAISSPTVEPGPVTRLKTPGGRSASTTHSASATAQSAVRRRGRPDDGVPARERGRDQLGRHRVRPVPRA